MHCPICGNEMEPGYIQCGSKMAWVKSLHKVSLLPKDGEVLLGNNVFSGLSFEAHICKTCKKVLLDYSKAEIVEK